jgi:hypothetical protein
MKQLMENWRTYLEEQERQDLEEGMFQDAIAWMKNKGKEGQAKVKNFLENMKEELSETAMGIGMLQRMASGEKLTPEESDFFKQQAKDVAGGTALLGLFVVPGGGVLTAIVLKIAKSLGVELMPDNFRPEQEPELAERDWQDESDKIKDHPRRKTRVLDTGANRETGGGKGHQKRDKKRGKSAPPGAGGV